MLKKMRDLFLLKNNYLGEPKTITKEAFMALSDEEKNLVDVEIEDEKYIVKSPFEVTDDEMHEIIGITISNELSKIREFVGEIKFILQFVFISAVVISLLALFINLISI